MTSLGIAARVLYDDTSDGTSSASEDHASSPASRPQSARPAAKKRKATYYQRKDEIEELHLQVAKLQEQLARLEGYPSGGVARNTKELKALYERDIENNNLTLAGTQAMLSAHYRATALSSIGEATVPLTSYIHLPVGAAARATVLRSLRPKKLCAAQRFLAERTRSMDLSQPHKQEESFMLPNGDAVKVGFDVVQFEAGHSVRQVYDEFMFFISHQEMSVSENLGILTVRESEDFEGFKFGNTRFLSMIPEGLEIESNAAMFTKYENTPSNGNPSYALGMIDFVNQDDLNPYRPGMCGRKDITAAILFVEIPAKSGAIVAMARWSYVRFRAPKFPISNAMRTSISSTLMHWCEVMSKVMKERLSLRTPHY